MGRLWVGPRDELLDDHACAAPLWLSYVLLHAPPSAPLSTAAPLTMAAQQPDAPPEIDVSEQPQLAARVEEWKAEDGVVEMEVAAALPPPSAPNQDCSCS